MAVQKKTADIQEMCSSRAERFGLPRDNFSAGLEYLALELISQDPVFIDSVVADESPTELDYSEWHTGGPSDGGIDGVLFNDDLSNVAIIQAKFKKSKIDAPTLEEARSFFNLIGEWSDETTRNKYNESTQRLLDSAQLDPHKQQIDLYFFTNMTEGAQDHAGIAEIATNAHREAGRNVNCRILTQADVIEMVSNVSNTQTNATVPLVSLGIAQGDYLIQSDGPYRILVGVIKGQELAALYNKRGMQSLLFNTNVRAALTTGKVNPKIQETASSAVDAPLFLYYNNGVTATCSMMDTSKGAITAHDFQVVNGAQTVAALAKALRRNPNPDVKVLLRVIETNDLYAKKSKVADQITRFQNTQNPVKASDFFSNEPFQLWISDMIDKRSGKSGFPATWYEHKRGAKSGQSTSGRRKLGIEQLATLRFACVVDAPFTYKTAKDIWNGEDNNQQYWNAFGREGSAITEWTSDEQAEVAWMIATWFALRDQARALNKNRSDNPERTYLGVLARYITALAFHLIRQLQAEGEAPSFQDLISDAAANQKLQSSVLKVCRLAVKNALEKDWQSRVANPRLNMPQDVDQWSRLKHNILGEFHFETQDF